MLEATSCSFAGLCFCLLAISAAALPSTFFCRSFLPLLLFGCKLYSRFFISPQAKPVGEKQHRKHKRLKTQTHETDAVANVSIEEQRQSQQWADRGQQFLQSLNHLIVSEIHTLLRSIKINTAEDLVSLSCREFGGIDRSAQARLPMIKMRKYHGFVSIRNRDINPVRHSVIQQVLMHFH